MWEVGEYEDEGGGGEGEGFEEGDYVSVVLEGF